MFHHAKTWLADRAPQEVAVAARGLKVQHHVGALNLAKHADRQCAGSQHVHRAQQHRAFFNVAVLIEVKAFGFGDRNLQEQQRRSEIAGAKRAEIEQRGAKRDPPFAQQVFAKAPR